MWSNLQPKSAHSFRIARWKWEFVIAEHACLKYSGWVGRSSAAKSLDEKAVELAVIARIRHAETNYDTLLASGCERSEARVKVSGVVVGVLAQWKGEVKKMNAFSLGINGGDL